MLGYQVLRDYIYVYRPTRLFQFRDIGFTCTAFESVPQIFFAPAFEIIRWLVRASMALCLYCISTSRARAAIANYPSHPQYSISHHLLNGPHNNHTHVIQILYNGVYS